MSENILIFKTKKFALHAIILYKSLQEQWEYIISKQFLRSATSIGANVHEAIAGQSKRDFYSKICIAFKEAHETIYWLELLQEWSLVSMNLETIIGECQEIIKMLASTKMTTERNLTYEKNN